MKTINHWQLADDFSESDCNMCENKKICKHRSALGSLGLPGDYRVKFECPNFKLSDPNVKK